MTFNECCVKDFMSKEGLPNHLTKMDFDFFNAQTHTELF
jgi:hypothetical protein